MRWLFKEVKRSMHKHLYTIPHGHDFLAVVTQHVLEHYGHDPALLARVRLLLPNRRSAKQCMAYFIQQLAGTSSTLPRIEPIGDLHEEDLIYQDMATQVLTPISPLEQQCILARLIKGWFAQTQQQKPSMDHMMSLAGQLITWLEEFEQEHVAYDALEQLVPESYAAHWQHTIAFLKIITEHLPAIYAEKGVVSPMQYRNAMMLGLTRQWQQCAPDYPVIIAGSTGSIPATRLLMDVVCQMPQGKVILPGLDQHSSDSYWQAVDAVHPQYMMKQLLAYLDITREQVVPLVNMEPSQNVKQAYISEAMRPAGHVPEPIKDTMTREAMEDITCITCESLHEEAMVIGLMMRYYLEQPDCTVLVVTNNHALIQRLAAVLPMWHIEADMSVGEPLGHTPPGVFFQLVAELVHTHISPVALLALFKHPLAAAGVSTGQCRHYIRAIEKEVLRGVRSAQGFEPILHQLDNTEHKAWLQHVAEQVNMLFDAYSGYKQYSFAQWCNMHIALTEWLASTDDISGEQRVWQGDDGQQFAQFLHELLHYSEHLGDMYFQQYVSIITVLLNQQSYRKSYNTHPRVSIMNAMEARLLSADVTILADMNEGSWPATAQQDPWMNRAMRAQCGLPDADRRIGQAAQDFYGLLCNPKVYVTRAAKGEGGPRSASRWLLRLDMMLAQYGMADAVRSALPWQQWAQAFYMPATQVKITPPAPVPPVEKRPRSLSVTQIETLMKDPYAIYAAKILQLKPLDALNQDPGGLEFGNFIHEAVDLFIQRYESVDDKMALMLEAGKEALGELYAHPSVQRFWWPKFVRIAVWFVEHDKQVRADGVQLHSELWGEYSIKAPAGDFMLKGKTDRIEIDREGGAAIVDYKTGYPPSIKDIKQGNAPQLSLEALLALHHDALAVGAVHQLAYWHVVGGDDVVRESGVKGDEIAALLADAERGLQEVIAYFDTVDSAYLACPDSNREVRFNDYAHLERVEEWSG